MLKSLADQAATHGITLGVERDGRHVHVTAQVTDAPHLHTTACAGGVPDGMDCAWEWGGLGEPLASYQRRASDPPVADFEYAGRVALSNLLGALS